MFYIYERFFIIFFVFGQWLEGMWWVREDSRVGFGRTLLFDVNIKIMGFGVKREKIFYFNYQK